MKKKIKPILPSLREKKRYVAFEVISDREISGIEASKEINESLSKLVGLQGTAKAGIMFLENKWNPRTKKGIFKVSHKHVDELKASFVLAGSGKDIIFKSLGVSGILNKVESRYLMNQN